MLLMNHLRKPMWRLRSDCTLARKDDNQYKCFSFFFIFHKVLIQDRGVLTPTETCH